jgi:NTE family protein
MLRYDLIDDYKPTLLSQILREKFAGGSPDAVAFVEAGAQYLTLESGDVLLRQGETGDDIYFVLSGRLRAETAAGTVLGEIGRGEPVGELAMFTGETRSASIVALRRTIVARISRELIERAIAHRPDMALHLTRRVIERFRKQDDLRKAPTVPVTVCILPITDGVDAAQFARSLRSHQPAKLGRIAVLDSPGRGAHSEEQFGRTIDAIEPEHGAVYLVADPTNTSWTRACLRHADEILLLADATASPALTAIEEKLLMPGIALTVARQTLVLVHGPQVHSPSGTARWLGARGRPRHLHIRPHLPADMARLARTISGRAVGLVFAGGGARGFAHIGVYQALEAAGVPVDFIGGTSIGALMGTLVALDVRGEEMERGVREGFLNYPKGNITGDFNLLPVLSLLKGGRSRDSLLKSVRHFAGHDIDMEDTWKPFFVMGANFSYGREDVLDAGPLVRNVTASFSIPGALPPVIIDGSLMFDGGTFNNLPVDVMARMGVGKIIGVDVTTDRARPLDLPAIPGPLALLADRFRPRSKQRYRRLPTLPETMLLSTFISAMSRQRDQRNYADILFRPGTPRMGMLDWHRFEELVVAGRDHGRQVLASMGRGLEAYR